MDFTEKVVIELDEYLALLDDQKIIDYLADPNQNYAQVSLPKECVLNHLDSFRSAVLECMEKYPL